VSCYIYLPPYPTFYGSWYRDRHMAALCTQQDKLLAIIYLIMTVLELLHPNRSVSWLNSL